MKTKKELFIVEGKSAASTLQQVINKKDQSILAMQGKLINVTKATSEKVYANEECQKLIKFLNCGVGEKCDPDKLNYSRVLILSDPDMDGTHARALLLTFFDRYLRALIDAGLVSVIVPPLFRLSNEKIKKKYFAWKEEERDKITDNRNDFVITRFKGIAQFTKEECVELFIDPQTRRQIGLS